MLICYVFGIDYYVKATTKNQIIKDGDYSDCKDAKIIAIEISTKKHIFGLKI